MGDFSKRNVYYENSRRPYSWTGDLEPKDILESFQNDPNDSMRNNKSSTGRFQDINNSIRKPHRRVKSFRNADKPKTSPRKSRFNLPPSSSQLLEAKVSSYIQSCDLAVQQRDSDVDSYQRPVNMFANHNQTTPNIVLTHKPHSNGYNTKSPANSVSRKDKSEDKRRRKLTNLRRNSPTSQVTDFEYFSLSDPPTGLAKPIQIFPNASSQKREFTPEHKIKTKNDPKGDNCRDCMTRIPYATLIATILCCVGVGVFCGTMYRGTTLTLLMFDEVFRIKVSWVEPVQLTFMIIGAAMGGLGLMILFLGCLSTGSTRTKIYRTWRGRVGGRISCALFMGITYLLAIIWLVVLAALVVITVFYTLAWFQCQSIPDNQCIDYNQFEFLFPSYTNEEDRRVCQEERKTFCKDCVNNAEVMFIMSTVSAFLVVLSLIHYLMCLSANYAHIKDQEKFMDLQEIQYLQESEMSTLPKDRF